MNLSSIFLHLSRLTILAASMFQLLNYITNPPPTHQNHNNISHLHRLNNKTILAPYTRDHRILPLHLYLNISAAMVLCQVDYLIEEEKTFGFVDLSLYCTFFNKIQKFFVGFWFFLLCHHSGNSKVKGEEQTSKSEFSHQENEPNGSRDSGDLERDEVKMVMAKLGIFCSSQSEELQEKYGSKELSELFEEQEPSLEEVKQAFDVFDENKDGFIDARELQRVLCILGLREAAELENCQKMIGNFDEDQDGRIDFIEFVKIMENRFC